jgi:DNA-binding MarR family transcriptional regulator
MAGEMKTDLSHPHRNVPESFLDKFGAHVTGVLSGFDRLRLRGTLRMLFDPRLFELYLGCCHVMIKSFKRFSEKLTQRVRAAAYESFERAGRPIEYLRSAEISKEDLARQIAQRDGITEGRVVLFSALEPCLSYKVRGQRETKEIHMALETCKCTHLYHYYMHPVFGLMHVRVQTWFPYTLDVCLNGREWLSRQMDEHGIGYRQQENCFVWVEDAAKAQDLLDAQLRTDWPQALDALLEEVHPLHREITAPLAHLKYYWSATQSEYATDVIFEDAAALKTLYPKFVRHAMQSFSCPDVLRFLGKRVVTKEGAVRANFTGEVTSNCKERPEGIRVKHTVSGNSVKMYDKQGSILRVETTILHPEHFKVFRPKEADEGGEKSWRKLRRGVADLWRRAEVSHGANERYLAAIASVTGSTPLKEEAAAVCRRVKKEGRAYRALNPLSMEDGSLLQIISKGEFVLKGFRNRDVREPLCGASKSAKDRRRQAAAITRKLAILRAHGLIKKVPKTHRYQLTDSGRRIITALLSARNADIDQLTKLAA